MIFNWFKNKLDERKKRQQALLVKRGEFLAAVKDKYFQGIVFPVCIFTGDDFIAVSDFEEYINDPDIYVWAVETDSRLIDSSGQEYNFIKLDRRTWAPNQKTGAVSYEVFKNKIMPMLKTTKHKQAITAATTIKDGITSIMW